MKKRSMKDYLLLALRGASMGAADVIPGVSGGTIALITGIYEELINSIKSFNRQLPLVLFKQGIASAWKHINGGFLLFVGGGILISIFSLSHLITWLLSTYPLMVWAFFFGLIVASVIHVGRKITKWNPPVVAALLAGAAVAGYITVATPAATPDGLWFIFLSGVIAICAMILPGISGSFILLLLGKYAYVLRAVKTFNMPVILIFSAGCAVGIIGFSNIIAWLFRKIPQITLALLTGFMAGSLNKLWPWKEALTYRTNSHGQLIPLIERSITPFRYAEIYKVPHQLMGVLIAAACGFLLIILFDYFSKRQSKAAVA